ncbi:zinc finger protein 2-like [Aphidius gifuensis]|uniref:zinc finger protein 2-like n=1 Tax=Aphidius gifuensis TaxID=684658 RepID=UPI001CDD288F|nr:zinc finger protein 2-like [Aphidius gifuensis]
MNQAVKLSSGTKIIGDYLKNLMISQTFADVALCCMNGQRFFAHRLVLSAASPYLQEVLLSHDKLIGNYDFITIILPEIEAHDLSALLGFVYTGSTSIPPERFQSFLQTANVLKIQIPPLPIILDISSSSLSINNPKDCNNNCLENKNNHLIYSSPIQDYPVDDFCLNLKKTSVISPTVNSIPKCHVANRVSASPWCQLTEPHHFSRQQSNELHDYSSIAPINITVGPFTSTSISHSPSKVELERSLNVGNSTASSRAIISTEKESKSHTIEKKIHDQNVDGNDGSNDSPKILTALLNQSTVSHSDLSNQQNHQYNCQICNKEFRSKSSLKIHERTHSGKKPFRCLDCRKEFSQLRNYKYHRSQHEGTGEYSATCPECGKYFNDKGYLGSHMKIHRNRKEYSCEECGKSFNQRVAYNMHVKIHSDIKPHRCDECGKSFSRKTLLKQHFRTHSGERPYQCHICHKAFADRSNMTLHTRLHSGVKPYQCDICSKSFTKKHHLKTHINYHTGTKPYQCTNCKMTFSQSSNMRTHYKKCVVNKPSDKRDNAIDKDHDKNNIILRDVNRFIL